MAKPRLFFGTREAAARLLEAGPGETDAGDGYTMSAKTNKVAPNGVAGEAMFHNAYLTIIHFAPVTFRVETLIDGVSKLTREIALGTGLDPALGPFTEANRLVEELQVSLAVPYLVGGVERLRQPLRGTWIEQIITCSTATFFRVDQVEVEWTRARAPARAVGAAV